MNNDRKMVTTEPIVVATLFFKPLTPSLKKYAVDVPAPLSTAPPVHLISTARLIADETTLIQTNNTLAKLVDDILVVSCDKYRRTRLVNAD